MDLIQQKSAKTGLFRRVPGHLGITFPPGTANFRSDMEQTSGNLTFTVMRSGVTESFEATEP